MKVSIIVPVWNSAKYIERCIENLREQTFKDFEAIFVVDSRSNDKSKEMVESIKDLDIKVLIQTDEGRVGSARNMGLSLAKGEYIWFLDVDDDPMPTMVETLINLIEKTGADISSCNFIYRNNKSKMPDYPKSFHNTEYTGTEALLKINEGKISTNVWDKLFKSSLIREHNIHFEKGYSEDYHFVSEACISSSKIVYTSEPLYVYNINDDSRSSSKGNEIATKDVEIFEHYREVVKNNHPELYPEFCHVSVKHILRSLTMADWETCKKLISRESITSSLQYCVPCNAEVRLFILSPRMYHLIGVALRSRKYSRKTFIFNDNF